MLSKFGMQIHSGLSKRMPSLNPKPEVDLRRHGRSLEKSKCAITSWFDLDEIRLVQNHMPTAIEM